MKKGFNPDITPKQHSQLFLSLSYMTFKDDSCVRNRNFSCPSLLQKMLVWFTFSSSVPCL